MKIPKYVQDIMARSQYFFDFNYFDPNTQRDKCACGYTISIRKATPYTYADTFHSEINRLKQWVEKQNGGCCYILYMPNKTKHNDQYAIVTIFDPVMQHIEKYISPNTKGLDIKWCLW